MRLPFLRNFRIIPLGRSGLEYREGKKRMRINSEMLVSPDYDIVVESNSIDRWEPPHDLECITQEKKEEIRGNVEESLRGMRVRWE
jgi:hypothetical protein